MNYSTKRLLRLGAELILVYFITLAPIVIWTYNKHVVFPKQVVYHQLLLLIFFGIGIWVLSKLFHSPFLKSFGASVKFPPTSFVLSFLFLLSIGLIQFIGYHPASGREWAPRWIWTWDKKTFLIFVTLARAFQEEWMFRGYLFTRLLPTTKWQRTILGIPVNSTIIVTTILFSLDHAWGAPSKILWALYPGFFLGALRQKTGNIFLPFLCHALVNLWDYHFIVPTWLK